nr:hypothetical protein [Burkholderia pyrrocinia]
MARHLRAIQRLDAHGGWDLYVDGAPDVSCSVKAYFALKRLATANTRRTWSARATRS